MRILNGKYTSEVSEMPMFVIFTDFTITITIVFTWQHKVLFSGKYGNFLKWKFPQTKLPPAHSDFT